MSSGFDLLGDPLPTPAPPRARARAADREPTPAVIPAAQIALANSISKNIRLGTSTWSFPGWAGIVYGDAFTPTMLSKRGLQAYAQHPLLRTVGIDRTFYAPISQEEFANYAAQVGDDFSFLCKAPNAVTSPFIQGATGYTAQKNPNFLDAELAMKSFVSPALAGLGIKSGPLVFQFSPLGREATQTPETIIPRMLQFLKNVSEMAKSAPQVLAGKIPAAQICVEVRNAQLLIPEFAEGLAAAGVGYCVGVHPRMPSAALQLKAMAAAVQRGLVVRWSLNPHTGADYAGAKEQYAPFNALVDEDLETRATLASAAIAAVKRGEKVHLVANNKAEGSSPLSMIKLAQSIAALQLADEDNIF